MSTRIPQISVLIPVYNVEKFLGHCLDSALAQTFTDFEVICVDDGSTDSSTAILARYAAADPRIRPLLKAANEGPMAARTDAIARASGRYLFFLDSDDWLPQNALQLLHDAATATGADITVADMCLVNPAQKLTNRNRAARAGNTWLTYLRSMLDFNSPSLCGSLFRKSLFDSFSATSLKRQTVSEDRMLLTELLVFCHPSIATVSENAYFYRSNPASTTHRKVTERTVAAQMKALMHCHSLISQHVPELLTDSDRFLARWLCLFLEQGISRRCLTDECPEAGRLLRFGTLRRLVGSVKATHARLCSTLPGYSKSTHALHRLVWHLKGID